MVPDRDPILDLVSAVSGDDYLKVEEDLGEGFVRLKVSEAERRQAQHDIRSVEDVVIELLRNSRDAHARHIFVAIVREGPVRTLVALDDGVGIPTAMHQQVFEPRVTSKLETMATDRWGVHGRGMALFSIRSNVSSVAVQASEPHKGTSVRVVADTDVLPEKSDQSTWPTFADGEEASLLGPHNLIRKTVEFALDHPDLRVYLGTPTEILATVYRLARDAFDTARLAFSDETSSLPLWQRPVTSADARSLVVVAQTLGLDVSERTAHRIMADRIDPLLTVSEMATPPPVKDLDEADPDIFKDRRGLKLHHSDLDEFKRDLHEAFDRLGERYYLTLRGEPRISVNKDEIRVRFPVDKED